MSSHASESAHGRCDVGVGTLESVRGRGPWQPSAGPWVAEAGLAQWRAESPICIGNGGATWLRCAGSRATACGSRARCRLTPGAVAPLPWLLSRATSHATAGCGADACGRLRQRARFAGRPILSKHNLVLRGQAPDRGDHRDIDHPVVEWPGVAVISSLPARALLPIVQSEHEMRDGAATPLAGKASAGVLPSAHCESGPAGSSMPVPPRMQGWPVGAPVDHVLLLHAFM